MATIDACASILVTTLEIVAQNKKGGLLMAVSQFLRPGSLLESVQSYLSPGVIHSASWLVGESEASTRQTMNGGVASVLSGLTNMVSSREGAGNLFNTIREGGFGSSLENIGSF